MKSLPLLFLILASALNSPAAEEESAPVILAPADSARWRIDYDQPEPSPEARFNMPRLKTAHYTVANGIIELRREYTDQSVQTAYLIGTYELIKSAKSGRIRAKFYEEGAAALAESIRTAFPGVAWITPELKVSSEMRFQEPCDLYQLSTDDQVTQEAWISRKTGLPVAFREGPISARYTFLEPPTAPITIPQEFVEFARMRGLTSPPN